MKKSTPKSSLTIRIADDLRARLEKLAASDHRTLGALVHLILERAVDAAEGKDKGKR